MSSVADLIDTGLLAGIKEGLVVHPGDTLVLRIAHPISAQQFDTVRRAVAEAIPDAKVVVLAADGEMAVLRG